MDCQDAQALISETLDGVEVDRAALDEAKQHCRACPDCSVFVRGLAIAKRAPLPQPDPALVDRVMDALRAEAAATAATAARQAAAAAAESAEEPGAPTVQQLGSAAPPTAAWDTPLPTTTAVRTRPRPAAVAAWVGAAALLIASAGTVGLLGVRFMSQGRTADESAATLSQGVSASSGSQGTVQGFVPPASSSASGTAKSVSAVPSFITFDHKVYRLVGVSDRVKAQLTTVGSTTSSLDGGELRARDVLQLSGEPEVYVENDRNEILEFKIVERTYQGRTYRMRSADLFGFGSWPALPADVAQTSSADTGSTFIQVGPDSSGVTVYRLATSTPDVGIAIAPGTPSTDPAGGNPGWTWWTPSP